MARHTRNRSRSRPFTGSRETFVGGALIQSSSATITATDTCADSVGRPVVDSNFSSTQYRGKPFIFNGTIESTYTDTHATYSGWPVEGHSNGLTTTPLPAPSGWYLDLVAGTNPSRPSIVPLELVQDIFDFPKQLRQLFGLIRKPRSAMNPHELAGHYLGVQFGWLPFIEDLQKLLDFQSYAIKRQKELTKLYSGSGLRRRLKFSEEHTNASGTYYLGLTSFSRAVVPYDVNVVRRTWGTIHWTPTTIPALYPRDEELNRLSRQVAAGLTVEGLANGVWKVLPWTWLIGWFTNVGKYTLAYSNTVPASHSGGCFMSESVRTYTPKQLSMEYAKGDLSVDGGYTLTTKTRVASGSLTPGFNVPFLDTFRLSVLGALTVQRTMRWRLFT